MTDGTTTTTEATLSEVRTQLRAAAESMQTEINKVMGMGYIVTLRTRSVHDGMKVERMALEVTVQPAGQ